MLKFTPLVLLPILAVGCHFSSRITGSGVMTEEVRETGPFETIHLSGGMELNVRVGSPLRVMIRADDNLQSFITTGVEGDALRIRFEESLSSSDALRAEIDVPTLRAIRISGSADLAVTGVDGETFAIDVSGSCRGKVDGKVDELEVEISGSSRLDLLKLSARRVSIEISGSGKLQVNASEELAVDVSGSASVAYRGHPRVEIDQSGSASVHPLE